MNKATLSIIIIAIVIVVGVIGYFGYKSIYKTSSNNSANSNTTSQTQPNTVSLENLSFQPGVLSISVGDEVTWTNNDSVTHTIVADDSSFQSEQLNSGSSFKNIFSKPGTYQYYCSIHPSMTGKIIVK